MSKIDGMTPKQAGIILVMDMIKDTAMDDVESHLNRGKLGVAQERGIRKELGQIYNRLAKRLPSELFRPLLDVDNLN